MHQLLLPQPPNSSGLQTLETIIYLTHNFIQVNFYLFIYLFILLYHTELNDDFFLFLFLFF